MINLIPPNNEKKILLHSCCAPCSCSIIERMVESNLDLTIFYYNPNIYPQDEYELRKKENKHFAEKKGVSFIDADYDNDKWLQEVKGLEKEPERGYRCSICFKLRFEKTALFAHQNKFPVFATSLGMSRWKDLQHVNKCAEDASKKYVDVIFWNFNWRKNGGSEHMIELSNSENLYKQKYCGCLYSMK